MPSAPEMRQIQLVLASAKVPKSDFFKVSAALQKQAARDLAPIWGIAATVDPCTSLEEIEIGYWPVIIVDDLTLPQAAGVHEDDSGQPFALVKASPSIDDWSLAASHEVLEMLVDPYGNRLKASDAPKEAQDIGHGRVRFLLEVCDPSEAADYGYSVNGVLVSDFYTPNFFDPVRADGVRYSYTGAIKEPRQVLKGGYLTWQDPTTRDWWQQIWPQGAAVPTLRKLDPIDQKAAGNLRAAVDRQSMAQTQRAIARGRQHADGAGLTAEENAQASAAYANTLSRKIMESGGVIGGRGVAMAGQIGDRVTTMLAAEIGHRVTAMLATEIGGRITNGGEIGGRGTDEGEISGRVTAMAGEIGRRVTQMLAGEIGSRVTGMLAGEIGGRTTAMLADGAESLSEKKRSGPKGPKKSGSARRQSRKPAEGRVRGRDSA